MKVYIDGRDGSGWALDMLASGLQESLERLGINEARGLCSADIVHNLCWYSILNWRISPIIRLKRHVLVSATNFILPDDPGYALKKQYDRVRKIAQAWVAPSTKQKNVLESAGLRVFYLPHYLDLDQFKPLALKRDELCGHLGIPKSVFGDRLIFGSFQRDSLGSDLSRPKWQKGPELLIDLLKNLPKDKFILLLTGPRRHYVISQCKKFGIPYYYHGIETQRDDIDRNVTRAELMPSLYALCDVYLVTSKSEGGPKAVVEAAATKTFILSTDVGFAADFLNHENIFTDNAAYAAELWRIVIEKERVGQLRERAVEEQYSRCVAAVNNQAMDRSVANIYKELLRRD